MRAVVLLLCCTVGLAGYSGERIVVHPEVYEGGLRNPMKGFRPDIESLRVKWAHQCMDYVSMVRQYIRWSDIEETEADGVEKIRAYCDREWAGLAEKNIKVIPRVYLQWSGPKWAKGNPKKWWTCWPKDMTTGDWESEQFKDRVKKLVKKLGEAWDGDPRVAWVHMAIMGAWGEHHAPSFTPEMEKLFGDAFREAFRHKHVTVRRADQFKDYAFGLNIDNWGDRWFWDFKYPHTASIMGLAPQVREGRRHFSTPIEGEIAYGYPPEHKAKYMGLDGDHTLSIPYHRDLLIDTIRYCGCSGLGWIHRYQPTNDLIRAGASLVQKTWGYRYELDEVVYDAQVNPGGKFNVAVKLRNVGSAPFYYRWPVTAALLDPVTREVKWEGEFGTDIRTWVPGELWNLETHAYDKPAPMISFSGEFALPETLKDGRYILALAVLDLASRRPSLRFATKNYFKGGRSPVGYVAVGSSSMGGELKDVVFDDPNADWSLSY